MNIHINNATSANHFGAFRLFRLGGGLLFGLIGLMFAVLTLFVVPAPSAGTAIEVSGHLVSMSYPHPASGDISIRLDNGQDYYINRTNEASVDWKKMLSAAHPGDEVHLTVVRPFARRLVGDSIQTRLPVAGVQIGGVVYMDPAISAATWTAQARFRRTALILLLGSALSFLPEFRRLFRHLYHLSILHY